MTMPGENHHDAPPTDPRTVGMLITALIHMDQRTRTAAEGALVAMGEAAVEPLIDTVLHSETLLRTAASAVLCRIGEPALAPVLRRRPPPDGLVTLDPAWWARVITTTGEKDVLDILLLVLLGNLLEAQPERRANHEATLRQYFSLGTGDALLDWLALLTRSDLEALAEGLYHLLGLYTNPWTPHRPEWLVLSIEGDQHLAGAIKDLVEVCRPEIGMIFASCGVAGLVLAQLFQPDLIMTAIKYGTPNGIDTMNRLVSSPKLAHIPFFFLTTSSDQTSIERAKALGALSYQVKPFMADELIEVLDRSLGQIRMTQ
jgi:CheY-like chemotaxis protein